MSRLLIVLSLVSFLFLSGCGSKMALQREPEPVESRVIRKADWEVDFRDVYFLDEKTGWIIGDKGTIIHTTDGGSDGIILHTVNSGVDWSSCDSGVSENLYSVCFLNDMEGWIAGNNGLILHTDNGGVTWEPEGSGTEVDLYHIEHVKSGGLVAFGEKCAVVRRTFSEVYP